MTQDFKTLWLKLKQEVTQKAKQFDDKDTNYRDGMYTAYDDILEIMSDLEFEQDS